MSNLNPKKIIILIKKNNKWNDFTDVINAYYEQDNGAFKIYYSNGLNAFVSRRDIIIGLDSEKLDCIYVKVGDKIYHSFKEIILFRDINVVKIFFKSSYTKFFSRQGCSFEEDLLAKGNKEKDIFFYYKEIAGLVDEIENGGNEATFSLRHQYDNIDSISNESALGRFLCASNNSIDKIDTLIFPFDFNQSQYKAVKNAFNDTCSIIEGPPGTGKTQTILNIISNAIYRGENIAVCSNNNSAIENVSEKLDAFGCGYLTAMLGNSENIEEFFSQPTKAINVELHQTDIDEKLFKSSLYTKLKINEKQNEKEKLCEKLNLISQEKERYKKDKKIEYSVSLRATKDHAKILSIIQKFERKQKKRLNFIERVVYRVKYKLDKQTLGHTIDDVVSMLTVLYYLAKENEIKEKIDIIDKFLQNNSKIQFDMNIKSYSRYLFDKKIEERYKNIDLSIFDIQNYKRNFDAFTKRYPVILSTTTSLLKCTANSFKYDLLIIDESSQVSLSTAIIALFKAKRVVVVGDLNQLPQIDNEKIKFFEAKLAEKYEIPEQYRYLGNNILSSFKNVFGKDVKSVLLNEHYRCQFDIVNFSNRRFYNNQLICLTKKDDLDSHIKLIHIVPGNHARSGPGGKSMYSEREIAEVLELIKNSNSESIGVISPFKHQVELLKEKVPENVKVDTVHKFQGRECDEMIFTTVANNIESYYRGDELFHNFVDNKELINVAITRAKNKFTLVTSDGVYKAKKGYLGDLIRYIQYETNSPEIQNGTIKSVFDILYQDYSLIRKTYEAKMKRGDELSELLIRELLQDIIKSNNELSSLRVSEHVRLSDAIRISNNCFSDEELRYLLNPWAHIDFVVYNIFDKRPILFIEVDGVKFHEKSERQSARDEIKNKAFIISGVTFLRLKTNGNNEREQIENCLNAQA